MLKQDWNYSAMCWHYAGHGYSNDLYKCLVDVMSGVLMHFCCGSQELAELDTDDILQKQVEQLEKEKRELQERLKSQDKKVR